MRFQFSSVHFWRFVQTLTFSRRRRLCTDSVWELSSKCHFELARVEWWWWTWESN